MGRTSDARERLIESGSHLIHERGYTAVGVNEICSRAGVKKGSFYYFFPSKQELGLAVVDDFGQRSAPSLENLATGEEPPLVRLRSFIEASYLSQTGLKQESGRVLGCPFGNLALEISTQDDVLRDRVRGALDRYVDAFQAVLDEAVESGDLPAQETRSLARSVLALLEGGILMAKMNDDLELLRDLPDRIMRLVGDPLAA